MSWQIILQILFIIICAVITTAESSLTLIGDTHLEKIIGKGGKKSERLKKLAGKSNNFIMSLQTIVKFFEFISVGISTVTFYESLSEIFSDNIPKSVSEIISSLIIILIMTFILIIFGEFIPKCIAVKNPEKFALRFSGMLLVITFLFTPAVVFINAVSNGIMRIFGVNIENIEETVTEEEILMMSDAGAETGVIDEDENRIIKNVFAFDNMTAGQICTHRTEVSVLWLDDDVNVWEETIHRTRHSVRC